MKALEMDPIEVNVRLTEEQVEQAMKITGKRSEEEAVEELLVRMMNDFVPPTAANIRAYLKRAKRRR